MAELITIASDVLTARINPLGAELWSIVDGQDRQYMTSADPAYWTGHAPVLFPIVGELRNGQYRLGDAAYRLPRHGFARTSRFACVEQSLDRVSLLLSDNAETRAVFPFAFALEMEFRFDASTLHMEARVSNRGEAPLPFSLGFHPAFAWPLPGGAAKENHTIRFACDEPEPIRRLEGATGLLLPDPLPTPVAGDRLSLDSALFEADALIWDHLNSRALTYGAPGGASLAIAFPNAPMLGIWQKPGAGFICIEPWQGLADPVGFTGDFTQKPGIVSLEPGEARSFRMAVTVAPAQPGIQPQLV